MPSLNLVFDDRERTDPSPASHSENTAAFLNRVAGGYWDQVRDLVEDWASRVPEVGGRDIVARLRSSSDRQSRAAFWELYLHETFLRAGYEVELHPSVQGPRPPDFLVSRGEERFYVEATCVFGAGTDAGAIARRQDLYDAVERIHSPNFFLSIDVEAIGPHAPATSRLRRALERWLSGLNPDETELVLGRERAGEYFLWEERGWQVWFRPIAVRADARGAPDHRVLGVFGSGEAQWLDDASELRETIRSKGNAYGVLDAPFLIAVMVGTPFHDEEDTISALYGTWQIQFSVNNPDDARSVRARDGYWGSPGDWKHTHVSGVLLAHSVSPWRVTQEVPELWHHPHATDQVTALPNWRSAELADDRICHIDPAAELSGFYSLPAPWPQGEPFPRSSTNRNFAARRGTSFRRVEDRDVDRARGPRSQTLAATVRPSVHSPSLSIVMTFGGRTPRYSDFVQAVRAYAPSHLVEYLARSCAERGGWDVQLRKGMRPPWVVAAMVRDCIVASHEGRAGQLSERKLSRLFNLFNETQDVHGDDLQSLLTPILYEQFPYQQSHYEEIVRSIALLEDAYDGSREWPWEEVLGAPLADVLTMAFIIHTVIMQSSGRFELRPEFEEVVDVLGYSQSLPTIVAGLTRTIEEMKVAANSVPVGDAAHRRFAYNPLIRTPLVDVGTAVFAPVPSLIYGAVSPSVLYHRGRDAWGEAFTRDLGVRVQQYVGKQIELLSPHFTIVGEIPYEKGQLSADWFLVSNDLLIIVECKASRASLGTQLGTAALDAQFKRDIGKAKLQIERSAAMIAARRPEFAQLGTPRRVIGLVITAEPFYILSRDHTRELADGTPTLLGSIRDIEHLATLTGTEAERQLMEIVDEPEKRTWPMGNSLDVPPNREARNPILESVWERSPLAVPVARRLAESSIERLETRTP